MQSKPVDLVPSINDRKEVRNVLFIGVYQKKHQIISLSELIIFNKGRNWRKYY